MSTAQFLELDYTPRVPPKHDYGIGLVGAGGIVNDAHLPAYRKAGFRVLAITDVNRAAAERTAARFEIPKVCESLDELLETPGIDIVDVAVPAAANPGIAARVFAAGKDALVQKPMAETAAEAAQMVEAARRHKRKLAVNHQMRWAPSVRAAKDLLRRGWFGEVVDYSIQIRIQTNWDLWEWLKVHPYPELTYHTIHYLDTSRAWFGEPERIYASLARYPGSACVGPTRSYLVLEYAGDLRGSILVNHHSVGTPDDFEARFVIEGTEGRCEGLIGLLLNYPVGRSDVITVSHRKHLPNGSLRMELEGRWFPDAFIGPMGSLMQAIAEDSQPETSGQDVIGTMLLMEAAKQSSVIKQCVELR